jgi:hypothetical protein
MRQIIQLADKNFLMIIFSLFVAFFIGNIVINRIFPFLKQQSLDLEKAKSAKLFVVVFLLMFLMLTSLGFQSANSSYLSKVERFHPHVAPESYFFPTYDAVINSVLVRYQEGQTIVIIGGSSGFYGIAQPLNESMVKTIEDNLGAEFLVINLAFRGGGPLGHGYLVAESLIKKGYQVIYVADVQPGGVNPLNNVKDYEYFYWQAKTSGDLVSFLPRDRFVSEISEPLNGYLISSYLEKVTKSINLWNWVNFNIVGVFINPYDPLDSAIRARDQFSDAEVAPEVSQTYTQDLRVEASIYTGTASQRFSRDQWKTILASWRNSIPQVIRPRCIFAVGLESPKIRRMVPEDLDKGWIKERIKFANTMKAKGFNIITFAEDYLDEDYVDRPHLSVSGAKKTAEKLSMEILKLKNSEP